MWACPEEEKYQSLITVSVTKPRVKLRAFHSLSQPFFYITQAHFWFPGKCEYSYFLAFQHFTYSFLVEFTIFGINSCIYVCSFISHPLSPPDCKFHEVLVCLCSSQTVISSMLYTVLKNVLKFSLILLLTPHCLFMCIRLFPAVLLLVERNKNVRQESQAHKPGS